MDRYYVAKRRQNDGWGCANLYVGKIKIAVENRLPYYHKDGKHRIDFIIGGIDSIYGDDQKELRDRAFDLISRWFKDTEWKPDEAAK